MIGMYTLINDFSRRVYTQNHPNMLCMWNFCGGQTTVEWLIVWKWAYDYVMQVVVQACVHVLLDFALEHRSTIKIASSALERLLSLSLSLCHSLVLPVTRSANTFSGDLSSLTSNTIELTLDNTYFRWLFLEGGSKKNKLPSKWRFFFFVKLEKSLQKMDFPQQLRDERAGGGLRWHLRTNPVRQFAMAATQIFATNFDVLSQCGKRYTLDICRPCTDGVRQIDPANLLHRC